MSPNPATRPDTPCARLMSSAGAVPLLGVDVRAEVLAGHARAVVRQRYKNEETKAIEAVYTFPLPSRAVLTAFSMTVEGRRLEGEVQEREEAFRTYDDAITAGHGAALLEQERPNVFTANVGNLLPGEETIIEIEYVEPLRADEGAIRWSVPTLVAPRYMPGVPTGERTAHGAAEPTDRVPDADRISPPIGDVAYGIALDLVFDVGTEVDVQCPSHAVTVRREAHRTRVTFAQREVALDRDVVVTAYPIKAACAAVPLATVVAHRAPGGIGTFALTVVPDLAGAEERRDVLRDVVFVIDRSGSMGGASMGEAKTALRLCLRQLREGDRFGILAFDDSVEAFDARLVPFTQATLRRADAWVDAIEARGGTEMLQPLVRAVELAPSGVVVLLTDGEVGNEAEIEASVLGRRGQARIYSFGIGTNVSDALLLALAEKTGGAVESIHPGERVDEKVIAQFARATAPRVSDLKIDFRGLDVGEIAPAAPLALVDGEPFTVFGTYESPGRGAIEIRGKLDREAFYLEIPVDLPEVEDRPAVAKLWAKARIADLEKADVGGRRAETMKDRIVKLAKEHKVSSKFTSFVVVEKRSADRRMNAQPEARVVPVAAPSGWSMFAGKKKQRMMAACVMPAPAPARASSIGAAGQGATRSSPPAMRRISAPVPPASVRLDDLAATAGSRSSPVAVTGGFARAEEPTDLEMVTLAESDTRNDFSSVGSLTSTEPERLRSEAVDPVVAILGRQTAAGLWEAPGKDTVEASVDALLVLLRAGVTADHAVHGAQVKKAVDALVASLEKVPPSLLELALALAWLVSSGRRTRRAIEEVTIERAIAGLTLGNEAAVRAHVDRLAPAMG